MLIEAGHIYKLKDRQYRAVPTAYLRGHMMNVMNLHPMDEGGPLLRVSKKPRPTEVIKEVVFPEPGTEITAAHFPLRETESTAGDLLHVAAAKEDLPVSDEIVPTARYELYGEQYVAVEVTFRGLPTHWLADPEIPDWHLLIRFDDPAFDAKAGRFLRIWARPDGRLFEYDHPILGDLSEYRVADLVQVEI